jgi:uncharacterized membrane protein YphA (DoxX/SURF4 family)
MKIIMAIPRILLGLIFAVMPWLAILHLVTNPPEPPAAAAFTDALKNTGYMLPLIWGTEIVSGVLLVIGIFVPFALVLLAPVLVNIFLFHIYLNPMGLSVAIIACLLELISAFQHRRAFSPLFVSGYSYASETVARPAMAPR